MRTKLPFLMLALLPLTTFAQTTQSKESVYPTEKITAKPKSAKSLKVAPAAYCIPTGNCNDGDLITNVTVAGINNTTTCSTDGYGDFTAIQGTIVPGTSYPISVTVGAGWFERVSIWIDYNNNEIFDANEFLGEVGEGSNNTVSTLTGSIAVPSTLASGSYRLRVMVNATGTDNPAVTDACLGNMYSETEDYTLVVAPVAPQGCLTAPNGVWPTATANPACNGAVVNITTAAYAGEYSNVNVTAGVPYTFSTSIATYYITISNTAGTATLAAGVGSVTYTPTASGVVRFYSHTDAACSSGGSETTHTRSVKCGTPPAPPVACTDFKVLSNNLENGGFFGGDNSQRLALDLPIAGTAFTAYGMEPTVVGPATTFNFIIYTDAAGLPGTQVATKVGTIVGSTITGNNFGYDFYKYTVKFDTPFNFAANTKYWVEITSDAVAWESSTTATMGTKDAFNSATTTGWVVGTSDYVFNLVCSDLAVSDVSNTKVSYFPNPVKDVLTINSKNKIEAVHIYNVAGQKMPVSKVVDGKIDMSKFAPGVYIVSTVLEGGVNESFKVVKK